MNIRTLDNWRLDNWRCGHFRMWKCLARAWQQHSKCKENAWLLQSNSMAIAWQMHGKGMPDNCMSHNWRMHGDCMASSLQLHGKRITIPWQLHGFFGNMRIFLSMTCPGRVHEIMGANCWNNILDIALHHKHKPNITMKVGTQNLENTF